VNDEGLATPSLLKIQSGPLGNHWEPPFDGDEMNMHMPQNSLAEVELRHLAATPYQIISPSSNAPIIGVYQDSMLGSYQFTRAGVNFNPRDAMNLLMGYKKIDPSIFAQKKITNFEILSQITPAISLKYKTKLFGNNEDAASSNNVLEIENGKYIRGQAEKGVFASGTKGILNRVCNDFGNMACADYIDDLQQIITEYMKTSAFSVGISDLVSNRDTTEQIARMIRSKMEEVHNITNKVHLGIMENNSGRSNIVEFETQVGNVLNNTTDQTGKIAVENLNSDNRFVMIVKSGSKGSMLNISQMISCVGQQSIDGKRVPYGFDSRTLPHFHKYDDSPSARGFVKNSYISGLTAPELFFHAMGGRMGLIDTAVKTSQTGYIQRRLVKGLEDLKVEYDGTVRNNMGKIVQFSYGEDGIDTTRVENQNIPLVNMSVEDIYMHFDLIGVNDNESNSELLSIYTKPVIARMKGQRNAVTEINQRTINKFIDYRDKLVQNVFKYKNDDFVKAPVAFAHIIQNIQGQLGLSASSAVDITPFEYIALINDAMEDLDAMFNPTEMFKILYYFNLSPKEILVKKRFNQKAVELLLETIVLMYKKALVHPGEMVGVIAGQSIGEPTTQLTLNSVTYETEIIVRGRNGIVKKVQIGDFTKEFIEKAVKKEYYAESDTTYAELEEYYEVPSCNEDGACSWERIEAVTKHPVINKDGTNVMLRITTKENREVVATKAKSFLKLVDGKIIGVNGDTLRVGDYIPVSKKAIEYTESSHLDLKQILMPSEYLYGSEVEKAKSVMNEYHWWSNHSGKLFTLPYSRSDAFVDKVNDDTKKKESGANTIILSNCVYSKKTSQNKYTIPESIELNYNFGYLVGAYAAEGCMTKSQISIANNDAGYFAPILELCRDWNITTKVYRNENKNQVGWTSQDLRIYNTLLCRILDNLCGKLSHNKYVSPLIVFSNKECIRGFLDAYIGGDGTISKKSHTILMTSVSKQLLIDVQQMMNIVGVYSYISKPKKAATNNRGSQNIKQPYTLNVVNQQATALAKMLNMKTATKQQACVDYVVSYEHKYEYSKHATLVPNEIGGEIVMEERNHRYEDVLFDRIISIEEVDNTTPYAYDLTVENTRNFNLYNGLCQRDTFHLAGVATKSNVTRGVPRIEEILRLTRNPDKPSATVFLKPADQHDKDKAAKLCVMIEHTKLVDVVKSIEICFDPNDRATKIHKDKEVIEQFYEFEELVAECNEGAAAADAVQQSKWIVRMEIDAETLLDKNITMDDINYAVTNSHRSDVHCVFSDMNASNLVFRIRLNSSVFNKGKKKGAAESLDQSDEIHMLKTFQDNILNNIVLRGVSGIRNVNPRMIKDGVVKEESKYVRKDTWVLDTTGTNLMDLFMLDFIDYTRTYSNDIREIHNMLGIEAARQNILNEFVEVMEASDAYVNYHHLSILCDRMAVKAELVPMFRSGIISDDIGPISKGTYEMHTEMFLDASRHGEFDQMRGVSANVMCGQPGYYGTNSFGLLLDMKAIEETDDAEVEDENEREKIDANFADLLEKDDKCRMDKIAVDNNVSNLGATDYGDYDDDYSLF
jgi:DNA-directed RNA polymerase beta' subunit